MLRNNPKHKPLIISTRKMSKKQNTTFRNKTQQIMNRYTSKRTQNTAQKKPRFREAIILY